MHIPLNEGEYLHSLEALVLWIDTHQMKNLVEKTKSARDFLVAHDRLKEIPINDFEKAIGKKISASISEKVVSNSVVQVEMLKQLLGVNSFKKWLNVLGFLAEDEFMH